MITIQPTLEDYLNLSTVGNYATKPKESRPLLEGILLTNVGTKAIKVAAINDNLKPLLFEDVSGLTRVVLMPVRII